MRSKVDYTVFDAVMKEVLPAGRYAETKNYLSHSDITVYEHSLAVARAAYTRAVQKGKAYDLRALVRGALLHDYYLYDWHDPNKGFRWHGLKHHKIALANAMRDFSLSEKEKNIIYAHMFPLTFWCLPRYRETWLVLWADKQVAWRETMKKYRGKKEKQHGEGAN